MTTWFGAVAYVLILPNTDFHSLGTSVLEAFIGHHMLIYIYIRSLGGFRLFLQTYGCLLECPFKGRLVIFIMTIKYRGQKTQLCRA